MQVKLNLQKNYVAVLANMLLFWTVDAGHNILDSILKLLYTVHNFCSEKVINRIMQYKSFFPLVSPSVAVLGGSY